MTRIPDVEGSDLVPRDPDVHIAAMQRLSAQLAEHQRPGLEVLIARFRDQQSRGNDILSAALGELEVNELRERLAALADAADPPPPPPAETL